MAEYIGKVGVGSYSDGDTPPVSLDDTGAVRVAGDFSATVAFPEPSTRTPNLDSANPISVANSAAHLYGWYLLNSDSVTLFFHINNNIGSDSAPYNSLLNLGLTPGAAANLALPFGVPFDRGICVGCNRSADGSDTTPPTPGTACVNLFVVVDT